MNLSNCFKLKMGKNIGIRFIGIDFLNQFCGSKHSKRFLLLSKISNL